MIKIKEAVVVEGKYDKIKLFSVIDGLIIETRGFRIFRGEQQTALIRHMAETHGLLILADSDSAGFLIRHRLMSTIPEKYTEHAYIPDVLGKKRRKVKDSKENELGVEGVSKQQILETLDRAGVLCGEESVSRWGAPAAVRKIEKADLSRDGLTGGENSTQNRRLLLEHLSLLEHPATNTLLKMLNSMMTYEEYGVLVEKLLKQNEFQLTNLSPE